MFAQVIPTWRTPLSLPFFDYAVPKELEGAIAAGQLVTVPFRGAEMFAVVQSLSGKPSIPVSAVKAIKGIVFSRPLLSAEHMNFLQEMSELYRVSPGFLIQSNLPPLQKRKLAKIQSTGEPTMSHSASSERKFSKPSLFIYKNNKEKQNFLKDGIAPLGQTLIIVPEIVDIEPLIGLLPTSHKLQAASITSDLTDKELFERWFDVWTGEKRIIVGTRRALFLSFNNLARVVVDDEGNSAHKSSDMAPRFHAREAALYLAKHHGAELSLLTHTPSVESYYFAKHGVYVGRSAITNGEVDKKPSSVTLRTTGPQSAISIIDMAGETRSGNATGLSHDITTLIENHTDGYVFLFLNRRGSGGYISCRDCLYVLKCRACARTLTYHHKNNRLECHFCKTHEPMVLVCEKCGSTRISVYGTGTEQLEKEVKKIVPSGLPVFRIDSDVELESENILHMKSVDTAIIITTERGWPLIPWQKVATMVFVDPDAALFIPEYKATEDLWQKINDAYYRLQPTSCLYIQTKHVEHPLFQNISNPEVFYDSELKQRRVFGYPPFNYLIKLCYGHATEQTAEQLATELYRKLAVLTKNIAGCTITPPLATNPSYHQKKHWQVIIIKVPYSHYKRDIREILKQVPDNWKVDLNPINLLSW